MAYTGSIPDTAARPRDWQADAACRQEDPELFFDTKPKREQEARLVCVVRCPVRAACLANVKEDERGKGRDLRHGVVAGLTDYERWRLDPQASRGKDDPPTLELDGTEECGTYDALLRHLWRGDRVDGVCWSGQVCRTHGSHNWRQRNGYEPDPEPLDEPPAPEPVEQAPPRPEPVPVAAVEPSTPHLKPRPRPRGTTPHERRIYTLWTMGASDLDIARRMAVSVPAVKRVRDRLGLLPNLHARTAS